MHIGFLPTLLCVACPPPACNGEARRFESPQIAIPIATKAPTVDGTIHEDEWSCAARLVGLVPAGQAKLAARHAVCWLASDGRRVYFAVKSEAPPDGKLVATLEPAGDGRDVPTIRDDSVEVWLDPQPDEKGRGVFQAIFNSRGAIFDRQHEPPGEWRGDWKLASNVADGWWHFEGSVSLESLGVTGSLVGRTWGLRLARNWKNPGEQAELAPLAVQFDSRDTMSRVRWLANAPITQVTDIRTPDGRKARYTLRVTNPHRESLRVRVRIDSQPDSSQHDFLAETLEIPAGQTKGIVLNHPACHEEELIYTRFHLDSPDGRTVYCHREFVWTLKSPAKVWGAAREVRSPLDRIKESLLLHASFDEGPDADFAKGDKEAQPAQMQGAKFQLTDGVSGKAMLSGRGCVGVGFANEGNFDIREGTLSMWVKPVDWIVGEGDLSHGFFSNGRAGKGYFGVQMARFNTGFPHLQCYMIQYPHRKAVHMQETSEVRAWKPDQWHWVVLTWKPDEMAWYVDGLTKGRRRLDPPLSDRDLTHTHFNIGKTDGKDQTAIDEVKVFGRCLTAAEIRLAKLFCRSSVGSTAWEAVQLDFGHYPYYGKLKARVDLNAVEGKESIRGARLTLRRLGETAPLKTIPMPPFRDHVSEVMADVPDLTDGQYQLALQLDGGPEALRGELVREFERREFEWERNDLGKSDRILPPFTPMRVEGQTVHTVLREHTMNSFGLWDQVVSKGEPILTAPMQFDMWVGGKQVDAQPGGLAFTETKETRVVSRGRWSVGSMRAQVTSEIDYDGMMLCTLSLSGFGTVDRLDLVIPMKNELTPLGHFVGERCRENFAGYLPEGNGVVWDSSKTTKYDLVGPFCPYLWVGEEERGLAWFAENDAGWSVDGKTPCQQIERSGDTLTIRVRLIQQPTQLSKDDPRKIVFGLQATPVKPMPTRPAHWRTWTAGADAPGAMKFTIAGSTCYVGSLGHEPFPFARNLALWRKFGETRQTGKADLAYAEEWVDSYPKDVFESYARDKYLASVRGGFHMTSGQPDRMLVYVQGRGISFRTPEFQTFQDEWTMDDYNSRVWPMGWRDGRAYGTDPVPSWQDFTLWWIKRQMDTFTDGLYFDNFFMIPAKDRVWSPAYALPDGRIQPSVSWRNLRQMMKRTSTMFLEAGRHPMIGPHMTNVALVPMMSFAQYGLDWEWHYGRADYQDRWSRDHIRAACLGRQTGCAPVVIGLGSKGGSAEEMEWLHRTFNGVVLTHELIPCWYSVNTLMPPKERKQRRTSRGLYYQTRKHLFEMGIGTDACQTYNYWEKDYPLRIEGTETSSIVHRGKNNTVIIVTDWGEGGKVKLTLDTQRLKLKSDFTASDFETGEPVAKADATLSLSLMKHDYRTIVIED